MATLSDAILEGDSQAVQYYLRSGMNLNELDEYGYTPLIEAAISDNLTFAQWLLERGADPNQQDVTGGTALHWAAENNNAALCELLFSHGAKPNAYTLAGQPALTMPVLRQQTQLKNIFLKSGASLAFTQDYINTKLLGHIYELVGMSAIISPENHYVEVDFEGFYLEVTLGLMADSLHQFQNHFAARQLRRYQSISTLIIDIISRAAQLIKFQQYRVDIKKHDAEITNLLNHEPLIIPVGYEGHAITFIKYQDIWIKCDRREDSRLYDNIMLYKIQRPNQMNHELIKSLIYKKQSDQFINVQLDQVLDLKPFTELKIEAQVSGNCSWANVEACIPAIFFLIMMQFGEKNQPISYYKTLALNYFHRFRDWNKDRILDYYIQGYKEGNLLQKSVKAEALAAVLFQRCDYNQPLERERFEKILKVLLNSPFEYLLQNYLRVYYYQSYSEDGKRFYEFLKKYKLFNL